MSVCGHRDEPVGAGAPGGDRVLLVEAQDVQELLLELGQRGVGLEVGVDELGPRRRRAGQDRPVDLAAADDLAGLADRRQAVAAGAHGVEVVEQARGDRAGQRDRGAALAAEREDPLAVPRRDVLERVVGARTRSARA